MDDQVENENLNHLIPSDLWNEEETDDPNPNPLNAGNAEAAEQIAGTTGKSMDGETNDPNPGEKESFQIASDLHIEFKNDERWIPDPRWYITPRAKILILAGDIGSLYKFWQLKGFLKRLCPLFEKVIYVPGNQEYYNVQGYRTKRLRELENDLYDLKRDIPNLIILNEDAITIGDLYIAGCTLWSEPQENDIVPKFIVRIDDMDTYTYKSLFYSGVSFIKKCITHAILESKKLVLITHHCPSMRVMRGTDKKKKFYFLYASNLDYLLSKYNIHTWICGHTHKNFDFISEGGTRVVSNQKGKDKDRVLDYSKEFVIEV